MSGRVVVIGSINVDLVTFVMERPKPGETVLALGQRRYAGGKGANQAVAAAAAGAHVVMVGAVGDDEPGQAYLARLADRGIDVTAVKRCAGFPTGYAFITLDEAHENTIVVVQGANAELTPADVRVPLSPGDVVVLQLEIPLPTVAAAADWAHENGVRVVLNVAPYAAVDSATLALADPIVANELEAMALADSESTGGGSLIVTLGPNGAFWDGQGVPAIAVAKEDVVDTTGAGDAFIGALAAALAAGAEREAALSAAVRAGADAVQREGAQPDPLLDRLT